MSHYLIWARPLDNLSDLRTKMTSGDLRGTSAELQESLLKARFDPDGWVAWEEDKSLDAISPRERRLLESYFTDFTAESVAKGDTAISINHLPPLWTSLS